MTTLKINPAKAGGFSNYEQNKFERASEAMMVKKLRKFDAYDTRLFNTLEYAPRIISFSNTQHKRYDFNDCIRKYKDKLFFMFTVAPENLTLGNIGYADKWSRNRLVAEQFEIEINKRQAKQIIEKLKKILKRMKK